jgi:hypothetical protein
MLFQAPMLDLPAGRKKQNTFTQRIYTTHKGKEDQSIVPLSWTSHQGRVCEGGRGWPG